MEERSRGRRGDGGRNSDNGATVQSDTEISRKYGSVPSHMGSPREDLQLVGLTIYDLAITEDRESFNESGDQVRSGISRSDVS